MGAPLANRLALLSDYIRLLGRWGANFHDDQLRMAADPDEGGGQADGEKLTTDSAGKEHRTVKNTGRQRTPGGKERRLKDLSDSEDHSAWPLRYEWDGRQ